MFVYVYPNFTWLWLAILAAFWKSCNEWSKPWILKACHVNLKLFPWIAFILPFYTKIEKGWGGDPCNFILKKTSKRSVPGLVLSVLCLFHFFHIFSSENYCTFYFSFPSVFTLCTFQSVKWQSPNLFPHTVNSFPSHFIWFPLIVLCTLPLSSMFVARNSFQVIYFIF